MWKGSTLYQSYCDNKYDGEKTECCIPGSGKSESRCVCTTDNCLGDGTGKTDTKCPIQPGSRLNK